MISIRFYFETRTARKISVKISRDSIFENTSKTKMASYTSNPYGYQRPNPMAYGIVDQGMMGSAGVYGGAPVVSFPAPPNAPVAPQQKPYYRCWDNSQKKWFFWEKDSSVTSWTEPPAHITLIDHETGSIVPREQPVPVSRPVPPIIDSSHSSSVSGYGGNTSSRLAASNPNVVSSSSVAASVNKPVVTQQRFQAVAGSINPNYSAGVSRYTQQGSTSQQSGISAAEKARMEEADRLIAEQLQKQLSLEAEAELVASCPLPGEAAKIVASQKKKFSFNKPSKALPEEKPQPEEDIADMAKHGFVVKKQKPKKSTSVKR